MRTFTNYRLPYLSIKDHLASLNHPDLCLLTVGEGAGYFSSIEISLSRALILGDASVVKNRPEPYFSIIGPVKF